MTKWNSGPPPSLGWWPAGGKEYLRWWDGKHWSTPAHKTCPAAAAATAARKRSLFGTDQIYWSARPDSWPERSRT